MNTTMIDKRANATMNNRTIAMMQNNDITRAKLAAVTPQRRPCRVWGVCGVCMAFLFFSGGFLMSDDVRDPNGQSASGSLGRLGDGDANHDGRVTDHLPDASGDSQNGKDAPRVPPSDTAGPDAAPQQIGRAHV
jgi:hypothetical protein